MKDYIEKRVIELGEYMTEHKVTVRSAAKAFGISKSTVHKDVTERLERLDRTLYREVAELLAENKSVRHIRGGMATREKYQKLRSSKRV